MEKLILIATINIIPGFEEEVKKATIALAAETRKETGCELFLIHSQNDSPQTIVFYEIYHSGDVFRSTWPVPTPKDLWNLRKAGLKMISLKLFY